MTKGNPIPMPQGGMQGVNSMVKPVQPLNSMQMTQAQGLISPFQRDRYEEEDNTNGKLFKRHIWYRY